MGAIHARRIPPKDALNYLEKSLAIFEELGAKKQQVRALHAIGIAYDNDRRRELAIKTYKASLPLSEELGDKEMTAQIYNGSGSSYTELGNLERGLEYYQRLSRSANKRTTRCSCTRC